MHADNGNNPVTKWGGGNVVEPGQVLMNGFTSTANIRVEGNVFTAPQADPLGDEWQNNFLNVGAVDGLIIRNNTFQRLRPRSGVSGADVVVYNSKHVEVGDNRCFDHQMSRVTCVEKNERTCEDVVSKC